MLPATARMWPAHQALPADRPRPASERAPLPAELFARKLDGLSLLGQRAGGIGPPRRGIWRSFVDLGFLGPWLFRCESPVFEPCILLDFLGLSLCPNRDFSIGYEGLCAKKISRAILRPGDNRSPKRQRTKVARGRRATWANHPLWLHLRESNPPPSAKLSARANSCRIGGGRCGMRPRLGTARMALRWKRLYPCPGCDFRTRDQRRVRADFAHDPLFQRREVDLLFGSDPIRVIMGRSVSTSSVARRTMLRDAGPEAIAASSCIVAGGKPAFRKSDANFGPSLDWAELAMVRSIQRQARSRRSALAASIVRLTSRVHEKQSRRRAADAWRGAPARLDSTSIPPNSRRLEKSLGDRINQASLVPRDA